MAKRPRVLVDAYTQDLGSDLGWDFYCVAAKELNPNVYCGYLVSKIWFLTSTPQLPFKTPPTTI